MTTYQAAIDYAESREARRTESMRRLYDVSFQCESVVAGVDIMPDDTWHVRYKPGRTVARLSVRVPVWLGRLLA